GAHRTGVADEGVQGLSGGEIVDANAIRRKWFADDAGGEVLAVGADDDGPSRGNLAADRDLVDVVLDAPVFVVHGVNSAEVGRDDQRRVIGGGHGDGHLAGA